MKTLSLLSVLSLLAAGAGCRRQPARVGDAPRTETPAASAGWKEIATSGIALELPSDWKAIDFERQSLEQGVEQVFGNDRRFDTLRAQMDAAARQGLVKLFAVDSSTIGTGFATNCNVIVQAVPGHVTLEQAAEASVRELATLVDPASGSHLEYRSLPGGRAAAIRSELRPPNPGLPTLASIAFVALKGGKLATITFSVPKAEEERVKPVVNHAMQTFHFTQ